MTSKTIGVADFFHDGERAHVHDEILVAEGGAAFGEDYFLVAGATAIFSAALDTAGGDEGGLFLRSRRGRCEAGGSQWRSGLAAEEGGGICRECLQTSAAGLDLETSWTSVRMRWARVLFYFCEDAGAFFQLRAAEGGDGGAIGFVVGGFEDVGDF